MNVERPIISKRAGARRIMDGCIRSGSVSLREDLGWPVTFELRFPEVSES